jgi:predicted nuclease of restriction endonuclease-like (RecB) superfamily
MKFNDLKNTLLALDQGFRIEAGKSVNRLLTMRNWLYGFYIVEHEQHGEDRAEYGERLLEKLAQALGKRRFSVINLRLFRKFYLIYPQLRNVAAEPWTTKQIRQSLTVELQLPEKQTIGILQSPTAKSESPSVSPEILIAKLSFTHLTQIMPLESPLARAFYEIESIKGGWSVRELKRQIGSLLYERTGLSTDKEELLRRVHQKAEPLRPEDLIRSPYIFEFLGLPEGRLVEEEDLERALLDHLQEFLLELGTGFCFEARQKRVLIGDDWHFIDLVFYHRLLKCHILVDLKTETFKPGHAGQMNAYVNFFKNEVQTHEDRAPVGLLLCTGKHESAVQYALGGLDENIFVSQYKLLLPDEETLRQFIERERIILEMYASAKPPV